MSVGPEGAEKSPDEAPAFVEESSAPVETAPAPEPEQQDEKPKRPGKNAPKAEVQAWAEALGYSSEGTVKEIFARVDGEASPEASDDETVSEGEVDVPDLGKIPLDKLPIASQKGQLLLRVEQNPAGIIVLNIDIFGMIGNIPVSIPASDAGTLEEALADLRAQAKAAAK